MRLRRHCYDKPWRCPGWAGAGWKYPKPGKDVCRGGSFASEWTGHWPEAWRFHRCRTCGTVAIPVVTRWLDPTWWKWIITRRLPRWWENASRDWAHSFHRGRHRRGGRL